MHMGPYPVAMYHFTSKIYIHMKVNILIHSTDSDVRYFVDDVDVIFIESKLVIAIAM